MHFSKKPRMICCLLVGFLLIASSISADVITVPADEPTIQGGIDIAKDYDTVLVAPGSYTESLNFLGKLITVKSSDGPLGTTITNDPSVNLVLFTNNENEQAVLEGFTLQGGKSAVLCENAGPTIRYNILRDQNITNWGAISLGGEGYATFGTSPAVIVNNTIVNCNNGGISTFSTVAPTIKNNIIAFNDHYAIHRHSTDQPHPIMSYNCTFGNYDTFQNISVLGDGHVFSNPMFHTNYTLQNGSPCVDAGDPDPMYNDPDGSRNDMGAMYAEGYEPHEPAVLHVPSEYPTIQEAMNFAMDDDTILVAAGTYSESISFIGKAVTLISEDGAESTILGASSESYTIPLPEGFDSTSLASDSTDYQALTMLNSSDAVLDVSSCTRNTIVNGFTIDGNNTIRGVYGMNSSAEISDCIIQYCLGGYDAGGIFMEDGAPLIKDNVFHHNETPISGGAVFVRLGYGYGTAEIVGNIMYENISGNGPAVSLIEGDDAIVERNVCYDNIGTPGSVRKGAIYFRGDNIRVINNTVVSNTLGITVLMTNDCDVRNNIVVNNVEYGIEVRNHESPNPGLTMDYNDVWNNSGGDYWQVSASANDISENPMFDMDYSLLDGSPCIDAGDPNPIYNDPDGSRNDMGAIPFDQISPNEIIAIDPDIIYAMMAYTYGEQTASIYLGEGFEDGYDLSDIVQSSVMINDVLGSVSTEITTHPEFTGQVLKIQFNLASFVQQYGILWDESIQNYHISADFTGGGSFVESGQMTFVGHTSGDANADNVVNILDLTYLINYMYKGGQQPVPIWQVGDVDLSGSINILDGAYIINYLYKGGPPSQHQ